MRSRSRVGLGLLLLTVLLAGCGSRAPDSSALIGLWEGTLTYPGLEVRVALRITGTEREARSVTLLRPDQTDAEVSASDRSIDGEALRVTFDSVETSFEGRVAENGAALAGTWRQGTRTWSISLDRVAEISSRPRPQTPLPPYPYVEQEVRFVNPTANATLAGTLTLPDTSGVFPAVVLISGAGAQDRDGTILAHRPFRVLADFLTRRGIAVLRYDDRGSNASTGDRSTATSADYADDTLAGVAFLTAHPNIDPQRVGLIGHSEGGTIAWLAAAASPEVAFVVSLGTPGLPGLEYNLQYEASTARSLGATDAQVEARRAFQERVLTIVAETGDLAAARQSLRLIYDDIPDVPTAQVEATIDHLLSPWFRYSLALDPSTLLEEISRPVLALFGGKDVQVPPERNVEAIRNALARGGNPNREVIVLDGLNHFFQTAATGSPLEYAEITETLSPDALAFVADWIAQRTKRVG
jgi:uncharacterized protein